ncbi:hypothetical protein [Williamsia phyllosphaerae]|uniref:Lipoprotein n=1 Tax=Williamsia phyllosphaerae TaxID=885042 RepID=A0ABQ1U7P8_9NOCA|nr:hypothetical protein [Williamsia phyllosphaerae]GGF11254.1 hypothetical protein GCM10007298_04050 [Williamsia phyllosphaerae]
MTERKCGSLFGGGLLAAVAFTACGAEPGESPSGRSEVTVTTESSQVEATFYQVSTDNPLNTQALISPDFEQDLVNAISRCDPGGADSLKRRMTLSKTGDLPPEVTLSIVVAPGANAGSCANQAADTTVQLLSNAKSLTSIREILNPLELRLTGTVSKRP